MNTIKKPDYDYIKYYNHFAIYSIEYLGEIRRQICQDDNNKQQENTSLRLEVIDDLIYLKYNNIPL
jgi:hypothetical protein